MTDQWRPQVPGRPQAPQPQPSAPPAPASPAAQQWGAASQATPPRAGRPERPTVAAAYGDRFAAPVEEEKAPEKKKLTPQERRRILLPVVAGVVLLAVLAAAGYWFVFGRPTVDPSTRITTAGTAKAQIRKPDEVVRNYLTAVAAGRLGEAMTYGEIGPGARMLLTDDVGRLSVERAPMTDIVVSPADETATRVNVKYKLGGDPITTSIPVQRQSDGTWQLSRVTVTIQYTARRTENVPARFNGVPVGDSQQLEVVPGFYEITTGLPFIGYADGAQQLVTSLDSRVDITRLSTVITPEGQDVMQRKGRESLDACVRSGQLGPAGCPIGGAINEQVDPGSVQWTLTSDPWASFAPRLQPGEPVGEAQLSIATDVSFTVSGGRRSNQSLTFTSLLTCDLSVSSADKVAIQWKRL